MTDNRTMAELLRALTEGCAEAIVVPPILAEQFELKHSLINMMITDQFFGLEKDNPHVHIRAARQWLEKEPPRSIITWEDLVSKFINEFFPPLRTTNLRNEILNFQQRFDESFHEAWDRYKDLLRACHHHGFTQFHQLDTIYNALNPADQDSLNAAAGGNLLESTQDMLTIIENKSKQTNVVTTVMTAILKQFQATPPPAPVKAVEETCVTCGAAVNYNQGNPGYRPLGFNRGNEQAYQAPAPQNQNVHLNELEKVRRMNEANMKAMQTQIDMVKNELRNEMKSSIQTSLSNQTNEIKNMMASLLQINTASTSGSGSLPSNTVANPKGELKAITTRSGLVIDGPTVPTPSRSINPEEDEHVKKTFTDPDLTEYTIKVPPPPAQKYKPPDQREFVVHQRDPPLLSNKEKLQELPNTPLNENCSAVILKKLPEKLGDPGKFLIQCGFSELKCKAIANLGASINLIPLSVWKKLGLPELIPTRMTLELANRGICTPAGIARDVFISSSGIPTFSLHPELTSPEVNNDIFDSEGCKFDIEFDLKEIEFLLYQDKDSSLKDSIDQKNCAHLAEIFVDSIPAMFTDEHTLDYSSPLIFDVYADDFLEVESDAENAYDDPFDSKGEKIKESKLLIDELDLPCDFLPPPEYDSFIS
nr:hypothetical protein [Tanacetum cinerariifolium]